VRRAILGLLAVSALVLSGCGASGSGPVVSGVTSMNDNHGYHGAWLDRPYVVPPLALSDTAGKPERISAGRAGDLDVVFFGYTHCPDVCQVVMSTIASAYTRLSASQKDHVHVWFVTTDPARDTRPVLRTYLDHFDPHFDGLTGSLARIDALGKPLGVYIRKGQRLPSGGYDVVHGTATLGISKGRARLVWTQGTSPAQMAADLARLLKETRA
jgi:protein SCO1